MTSTDQRLTLWAAEHPRSAIERLPITVVDFDSELALAAELMSGVTRPLGLSLGDRGLSLARRADAPALTSDRARV